MNVIVVIVRENGVITTVEAFADEESMNEADYFMEDIDEENWPHHTLIIAPEVAVQGLDG